MRKFDFDNLGILTEGRPELFTPFADISNFSSNLNLFFYLNFPIETLNNTTGDTLLTNGDDAYITIMNDENILALDGNDLVQVNHAGVTVEGGAGDDTLRIDSHRAFSSLDAEFNGGDDYDTIQLVIFQYIGLDTFVSADVRGMSFTDVEALSLSFELDPDDEGPGGAGGEFIWDFLDISVSQLLALNYVDIPTNLEIQVFFDGSETVIDFRDITFENSSFVSLYSFQGEDKIFYLDNIDIGYGLLGAGADTIFVTYDPSQYWHATFNEHAENTNGIDVLDFTLMDTVSDGMGGTIGTLTHTMSQVTQTDLGLANNSRITVSNIDQYYGWGGKDIFIGDARDNYFDGNGGTDIAVYSSANAADYIVKEIAPGEYAVEAIGGTGEGTDTLIGIEVIRLGGMNGTDYDIETLVQVSYTFNGTEGDDVEGVSDYEDGQSYNALGGDDIVDFGMNQFNVDLSVTINGGDGVDLLQISTSYRNYGSDTLDGDNDFGGTVDITNNIVSGYGDLAISNFERLTIEGGGYGDLFRGGSGNDELKDGGFAVSVDGNGSQDYGLGGNDQLYGMDGNDVLTGTGGQDILDGGAGDDVITSGGGYTRGYYDAVGGGSYSEFVTSNATMIGGAGHDTLNSRGDDIMDGGAGDDTLNNLGGASVAIYSSANASDYIVTETAPGEYTIAAIGGSGEGTDTLTGIETIRLGGINGSDYDVAILAMGGTNLTNGDDVYTSTDGEVVNGLDGNDTLRAGGYTSTLNGDGGDDILDDNSRDQTTLNGGIGADTITLYAAQSVANGGADNDTIYINDDASEAHGDAGDDFITAGLWSASFMTLDGGTGIDTLVLYYNDFEDTNGQNRYGGTLDMTTGIGTGSYSVTVSDFESLHFVGGGYSDSVTGATGDDIIRDGGFYSFFGAVSFFAYGRGGDDVIYGMAGDDIIIGTGGTDVLDGGDGNDTITSGADYVSGYEDPNENEYVQNHEDSEATINGGAGDDIINSFGNDTIDAGAGSDIVFMGQSERETSTVTDGGIGIDTIDFSTLDQLPSNAIFLVIDLQGQAYSVRDGSDVLYVDSFVNFENATGSEFGDLLQGDDTANVLMGLEGDDTFQGRGGDDIINGGAGSDSAIYSSANTLDYTITEISAGIYTIEAVGGTGEGTDTLTDVEFLRLGGTTYDITALAGGGTVTLTTGDDVYAGPTADVIVNALDGNDTIDGGSGNNILNGDGGDDTLISLGNDILNGGTGNDLVEMGGNVFDASTATDGGADIDTISFSTLAQFPSGNLFLVLDLNGEAYSVRDGNTVLYIDQFINFENATGSEFGDLLQGDEGVNMLTGLGGDDNLQGREGDDVIDGGAGEDILNGGAGFDVATYASATSGVTAILADVSLNTGDAAGDSYIEIENITGSDFDDVLGGAANANIIDGGAGVDIASYVYASSAIVFDGLGLVTASGDIVDDTLLNIEAIAGTAFNDRLFGDNGVSIFYGGEGADRLFGRNGDDELYGEGGDDIILAGRDNDLLDGGAGNDQLRGNEGDDTLLGGDGNDVLAGGVGADVLNGGAGIDRVEYTYGTNAGVTASLGDSSINTGDAAGDTYIDIENLYGTSFVDTLYGDAGNNRIDGRLGDDTLFGGDGNDYLIGGAGDDVMNGEGGDDLLLGQAGADIYQFDAAHGTDRIIIFTQGEDLIEFTESVFDFSDLTITQDGAHVNIDTGEGTIIVNNSLVADFTADDFTFAAPPAQKPLAQEPLELGQDDMMVYFEVDALM